MMKIFFLFLYALVIVIMGAATIIEKYNGTDFVSQHIYTSWWFIALWAVLGVLSGVALVKNKRKNIVIMALHASFLVILLGAFVTHCFAQKGVIYLEKGKPTNVFESVNNHQEQQKCVLPFYITLNKFETSFHEGTDSENDYTSYITITDNDKTQSVQVSMNHIAQYKGVRLYQTGYSEVSNVCALTVNSDPYGIAITYVGYGILFVSLIAMLVRRNGMFRALLRNPLLKKNLFVLFLLLCPTLSLSTKAQNTIPKDCAKQLGEVLVLYNGRICPLQTLALDLTKKVYGARSYHDLTAEQVLAGLIFYDEKWRGEPFIHVKKQEIRTKFFLPEYCTMNEFFNYDQGGYILGPYLQPDDGTRKDALHQQINDVDEKIMLVMQVRQGNLLKVFPVAMNGKIKWFSPTEELPKSLSPNIKEYISQAFDLLFQYTKESNWGAFRHELNKMMAFQRTQAARVLPTDTAIEAEKIYNMVPFATILFMVNLTLGLCALVLLIVRLTKNYSLKELPRGFKVVDSVLSVLLFVSFVALTLCLTLRWIVSGTVPMSNGYETMLIVAWFVMLVALITYRKVNIVKMFAFLLSGFFLLVSHIAQMDPQITHVMPVLNSPLLAIHVSIVMMGYALLAFTFVCSLTSLVLYLLHRKSTDVQQQNIKALQMLSMLFLLPALVALCYGIFIGAIWANISWGQYWSWDPKETWALITLMVYAVPVHFFYSKNQHAPLFYHIYMLLAFSTVLMTYFGVNYFLGGMHSYA